jgi:hypothetical protein
MGVFRRALQYAIFSQGPVVFNLDRRTLLNIDIAPFHVNNSWRSLAQWSFHKVNAVAIRFCTQGMRMSFHDFHALRHWHREGLYKMFPAFLPFYHSMHPPSAIELHFDTKKQDISLKSVRINIVEFIRLTYDLWAKTMVCTSLSTHRVKPIPPTLHTGTRSR